MFLMKPSLDLFNGVGWKILNNDPSYNGFKGSAKFKLSSLPGSRRVMKSATCSFVVTVIKDIEFPYQNKTRCDKISSLLFLASIFLLFKIFTAVALSVNTNVLVFLIWVSK